MTEAGGIESAGAAEKARALVRLDDKSALALGANGFTYFGPLDVATWSEIAVDSKRPLLAAAAARSEVYAVDEDGRILRRSAAWTWVPLPGGDLGIKGPIAMWAGPGRLKIACADGSIVEGGRSG